MNSRTLLPALVGLTAAVLLVPIAAAQEEAPARFVGRLTSPTGEPVVGYRVVFRAADDPAAVWVGPATAADGSYEIELPAGGTYVPVAVISPSGTRVDLGTLPGIEGAAGAVQNVQLEVDVPVDEVAEPRPFPGADRLFVQFVEDAPSLDAWRIESAPQELQGVMAGAYQLGYRIAAMVGSAGALWIAAEHSFGMAYAAMGVLALIGILTTLLIAEPHPRVSTVSLAQEQRVIDWLTRNAHLPASLKELGAWFTGAVVCPFVDFFTRYGTRLAILILAFAASYRLTDFTMGVMANPLYIDVGYTLKEIAAVAKGFGLFSAIAGVLIGGAVVARLGLVRSLVLGSILVITSNLMFMTLAWTEHPSLAGLAIVVSADNLAMGVAGTALIAYLSSLTSPAYTATQYALFSSAYALPGKILMGGSGFVVDQVGYPWFFVYTSFLGLPALVLLWFVMRESRRRSGTPQPT